MIVVGLLDVITDQVVVILVHNTSVMSFAK